MMSKYIENWDELRQIPNESDTHILEVGECNAWLNAKNEEKYDSNADYLSQVKHLSIYLSTHTFYGKNHEFYTKVLQTCGFDVNLANWDKE